MQCSKCDFENPDQAKFCGGCGDKLEILCPQCNYINPLNHKFCNECGQVLSADQQPIAESAAAISGEDKFEKIQKYLPKGIAEKIIAQKGRIEGERKQVTVMFCDLVGFSTLSASIDPEVIYPIMDGVQEILIHKVHDYEGIVNKMIGDGIMALFGAPIALEDAPQRAIRSAFSIHREISKYSDSLREQQRLLPPLQMRIGIHTGPVVVGTIGNDLRVEFTAVGDTVNLASRMEGLAGPGTTCVSEQTYKLTEGLFHYEAIGEREVKGRKGGIKVYRPITPSTSRSQFEVSSELGLTPFIGRERELELLLDAFERTKSGRGQVFSLISEAGVGKSRLIYEFRKAVSNEDLDFWEGRCLSYSRGVVYHPVIEILKDYFDIIEEDGELEIKEKITHALELLNQDETTSTPFILELLSVKDSDLSEPKLSPEARKEHLLSALRQIVLLNSTIRPLVIVYENLHWIDKSSEAHLKDLVDHISGARVLLILTYRPEFVHTWSGRSYHNHLNLNRLSNRETLVMVSHLLETADIDEQINQLILEKTEGIPFFVEQLVSSLRDQKIIKKEGNKVFLAKDIQNITIPSTIQDVIMARVDLLPEEAKDLLQKSSVAGREFGHRLLQKITDFSEDKLLSLLSFLKDAELIYERGIYPQSTYVFKHALTQQVAYNSLLISKRKEIHQQLGKTIEHIYEGKLEEFSELLAYHFLAGEDWPSAYNYNLKAGLKVFSHSAYEQAQRYFEDALKALKNQPKETFRIEQEIDLRFLMRSALVPLGRHQEWGEWVGGAELLAREIVDDARLSNALNLLSSLHWVEGRNQKAILLGEKALTLAKKAEDISYQISTMLHMGIFYFTIGKYHEQIEFHQHVSRRLSGADAFQRYGLASFPSAWSRSHSVLGMAELGQFDETDKIGGEALSIAEAVKNNFTFVITYSFIGTAYLIQGQLELALPLLEKGHDLCRRAQIPFMYPFVSGCLGSAYLLNNEPHRALDILKEGTKPSSLEGAVWIVHPLTIFADAYRISGDMELAKEVIARALSLADEREERGFEAWAKLVNAQIAYDAGIPEVALEWYQKSLQQASDLTMLPLVAHCHKGLGNCHSVLRNENQATAEKESAIKIYRSLGMVHYYK